MVNEPRNGQSVNLPKIRGMLQLLEGVNRMLKIRGISMHPTLNFQFTKLFITANITKLQDV